MKTLLLGLLVLSSSAFGLSCGFPPQNLVLLCERGACRGFNASFEMTGFTCHTVPRIQSLSPAELGVATSLVQAKYPSSSGVFEVKVPPGCLTEVNDKSRRELCDQVTGIRELASSPSESVFNDEQAKWEGSARVARAKFWGVLFAITLAEVMCLVAIFLLKGRVSFVVMIAVQVFFFLFNRSAFLEYWNFAQWKTYGLVLNGILLVGMALALKKLFSRKASLPSG